MNKVVMGMVMGLFAFSLAGEMGTCPVRGHDKGMTMTDSKATGSVVCPVTKNKFVPKKDSDSAVYKGKTYYFCCKGCKPLFLKNPEKYVK